MVVVKETASNNIKFFYGLMKQKGLLQELMNACNVKSLDSLRWSYRSSRISLEQIKGYQKILGEDIAKTEYLIGSEIIAPNEKKSIEEKVLNTDYESNYFDDEEIDSFYIFRKRILNAKKEEELKKYKEQIEYLQKLIENEETLQSINFKEEKK